MATLAHNVNTNKLYPIGQGQSMVPYTQSYLFNSHQRNSYHQPLIRNWKKCNYIIWEGVWRFAFTWSGSIIHGTYLRMSLFVSVWFQVLLLSSTLKPSYCWNKIATFMGWNRCSTTDMCWGGQRVQWKWRELSSGTNLISFPIHATPLTYIHCSV